VTEEIRAEKQGYIGRIRLNRPKALHALTTDMCLGIMDALADFEADDVVTAVVFDHAEGRGFCAGGDIRMLADSMKGDGVAARAFFRAEYQMDHRLFTYAKPTVSIMDGITMGGGVGIALPCTYRVATENTRFAMPETGIGLFPDVGGSWYLSRLPGQVGKFMGLTGAWLDGAECLALGLATHYLSPTVVEAAVAMLAEGGTDIGGGLKALGTGAPLARIVENRTHIDRLFAGNSVGAIMADLEADGSDWAVKELATLRSKSPLSMAVALRQLREGAAMSDFDDVMRMEYRIADRVLARPDFIEGVRAVVIDKDNAPNWQPPPTNAEVDAIFAPLPVDQEWMPL
jgi:enoyl-CoA hydratase